MYECQLQVLHICDIQDGDLPIEYIVEVYDSSDKVVLRVPSSNCSDGICSALLSMSDQYCGISVKANNTFGESISGISAIGKERGQKQPGGRVHQRIC